MKKQEIIELLANLPDEIDPEQLMRELYLKAKLDAAEAAVARGDVVPQEKVVERSQEWFA